MSKEVKFKVVRDGIVYDGDWFFLTDEETDGGSISLNGLLSQLTLLQYTGLKDKNGKEVCEGDIVEGTESGGWEYPTYSYYLVVKWNDDALRLDLFDPFEGEWCDLADTCFDKVIGNIYENPELLK